MLVIGLDIIIWRGLRETRIALRFIDSVVTTLCELGVSFIWTYPHRTAIMQVDKRRNG